MKWLSISDIKKHSRIDYDCEDALLELYADAAEEMVMQITGRDYDNIIATYGDVPAALARHRSFWSTPASCSARRYRHRTSTRYPTPSRFPDQALHETHG